MFPLNLGIKGKNVAVQWFRVSDHLRCFVKFYNASDSSSECFLLFQVETVI